MRAFEERNGVPAQGLDVIYQLWEAENPDGEAPLDPFDGLEYGLERRDDGFAIWSTGPDGEARSDDDVVVEFRDAGP